MLHQIFKEAHVSRSLESSRAPRALLPFLPLGLNQLQDQALRRAQARGCPGSSGTTWSRSGARGSAGSPGGSAGWAISSLTHSFCLTPLVAAGQEENSKASLLLQRGHFSFPSNTTPKPDQAGGNFPVPLVAPSPGSEGSLGHGHSSSTWDQPL